MKPLIVLALVLAALSGCTRPTAKTCHVIMSAPVDVEWDAQCTIEHGGFPSSLQLTMPDRTWVDLVYAPSAHAPFLSFTAGWGKGAFRCNTLREPESWASEVEGTDSTIFTIALYCDDNDPEHAIALAVEYPDQASR